MEIEKLQSNIFEIGFVDGVKGCCEVFKFGQGITILIKGKECAGLENLLGV